MPDAVNVDKNQFADVYCDLEEPNCLRGLPNDHFEEIFARHTLEHISNLLPLMQELWRVAANGCLFHIAVPYGSSDNAWEDPTHVRAFFLQSPTYFSQAAYKRADYGYRGDWSPKQCILTVHPEYITSLEEMREALYSQRNFVSEFLFTLEAIKPAREPENAFDHKTVAFRSATND